MERTYNYPVWGTQGGGLVRRVGGVYIFVEKPDDCPGLDVGDEMPEKWGIIPANSRARDWEKDQVMFDESIELLFDTLFDGLAAGRVSCDQVGRFFPKDVRERNA